MPPLRTPTGAPGSSYGTAKPLPDRDSTGSHTNTSSHVLRGHPLMLAAAMALTLLAGTPGEATARSNKNTNSTANGKTVKKGVTKITYQRSSSEETSAERDRRMYRECKGMHNAGACLGYTRK